MAPVIVDFWERAEFPHDLVPKLAELRVGGGVIKGYGCPGHSVLGAAMVAVEMARVDASMSTFLLVHNSLAMLTIGEVQYTNAWGYSGTMTLTVAMAECC